MVPVELKTVMGARVPLERFWPAARHHCENMVGRAHRSRLPVTPGVGGKAHVVNLSVHSRSKLRAALNDVLGGGAASVLNVTFCMSYALLIFPVR